jgi:hypothetical protein
MIGCGAEHGALPRRLPRRAAVPSARAETVSLLARSWPPKTLQTPWFQQAMGNVRRITVLSVLRQYGRDAAFSTECAMRTWLEAG